MVERIKNLKLATASLFVATAAIVTVSYTLPAQAAGDFKSGENITQTSKVDGPFFGAGTNIQITKTVNGDAFVAGQTVNISADVDGDVIVAAQNVTITGTVTGDVRVASQNTTITGSIEGSVTNVGQTMILTADAKIGRDVHFAGETASIDGEVSRDIFSASTNLNINGTVGRDITYTSDKKLKTGDEATIAGETYFTESKSYNNQDSNRASNALGGIATGIIYTSLTLLVIIMALVYATPRWLNPVIDRTNRKLGQVALTGILVTIIAPGAILVLMITAIGLPLAIAIMLTYIAIMMTSVAFSTIYVGKKVLKDAHILLQSLVGVVIFTVLMLIPLVNILTIMAAIVFGVGMIVYDLFERAFGKETKLETKKPKADPKVKLASNKK